MQSLTVNKPLVSILILRNIVFYVDFLFMIRQGIRLKDFNNWC